MQLFEREVDGIMMVNFIRCNFVTELEPDPVQPAVIPLCGISSPACAAVEVSKFM